MNGATMRSDYPEYLVLLPLAALAAVLAGRQALGIAADPLLVIAAFFASLIALALATRHPAALVTPMLFLPRLREVPELNQFGPLSGLTALQLVGGLLGAAIVLRWMPGCWKRRDAAKNPAEGFAGRTTANRSVIMAFVFFAAVIGFSYIYTASPESGLVKLLAFVTLGCGMFAAPFFLFTGEGDFWDFTVGTVLFSMVVAASSLSFSAGGAMGALDDAAHIGKGQVIGLAILLLIYTPIKNRWVRLFVLTILIPGLAIGLVSAQTRGPLFSLMLVLVLSFILDSFRSPVITRRQMAFVGGALVGAVMLLSAFWFYGPEAETFRKKFTEIIALAHGGDQAHGTAMERLVFYKAALDLWMEKPLLGWGLGGWGMAYYHVDDRVYPHNLFLEVMVEQGLMGLFALCFFLLAVFRHLRANLIAVKAKFPFLLPGLLYLLSIAMFSGDLDDDRFIWCWCGLTLVGCALALRARKDKSPADTRSRPALSASA